MSRWTPERWLRPRDVLVGDDRVWDLADGREHADFADWCHRHPGVAGRVYVSTALLAELPVDASLPLSDDAELIDWARVQVRSHAGDAASQWSCAVWHSGPTRGVSVLHGLDLPGLRAIAAARGVRLRIVSPWWSPVLARSMRRVARLRAARARLLVVEGNQLAAVELAARRVTSVRTGYLDAATTEALADWAAALPAADTVACGHGLAGAPLAGIQALPGLLDTTPATAWRGGVA